MKPKEDILEALPGTAREVMARTGRDKTTVLRTLKAFYGAKKIHVGGWAKPAKTLNAGRPSRIFYPGKGDDVEPPKVEMASELCRRRREKYKNERLELVAVNAEILSVVDHAIRYTPNSVWALAGMRQ